MVLYRISTDSLEDQSLAVLKPYISARNLTGCWQETIRNVDWSFLHEFSEEFPIELAIGHI